jgi:hypothetical protein
MKLEKRGDETNDAETEVNSFLEEISDTEDVTGFICCVMIGDDRTKTLVAASPQQMLMFAEELVKVALTVKEYEENHVGNETLQ